MKKLLLLLFLPIMLNAQSLLLFGGDEYGFTISLGDSNSTFSDTTSVGDWQLVGDGSLTASNDSTLLYSNVQPELNPNPNFADWSYTDLTSGIVTSGSTYWISNYVSGDDFTNIGGTNVTDNIFTATGTTPTTWTNGSTLRLLVPPDGWNASTMDENNYVVQDANGLRFVRTDTELYMTYNGGWSAGDTVAYKIVVPEVNSGGIKIVNSNFTGAAIEITTPGTYSGTFVQTGPYFRLRQNNSVDDVVVSSMSIKNYHSQSNIQLPLASTAGQKYRATMQMKEYGGTVAPQPIISYGTKSQTKTALSDSWQNYIFDFTGEKVNDYYSFDGVNDYINVADDNSLDIGTSDFSICALVNPNGDYTFANSIVRKRIVNGYLMKLDETTGAIRVSLNDGTTVVNVSTSHTIPASTVSHLVATFDRDSLAKVYVDGDSVYSQDISSAQGDLGYATDLVIGVASNKISEFFSGDIYNVKIYNKALSQSEITTLYNNRNSTSPTTVTSGLVLDLNGIDGNATKTTWKDQSGNGNDGTVYGATLWQPPFLKVSQSDTAKVKIDNFILKSNKP